VVPVSFDEDPWEEIEDDGSVEEFLSGEFDEFDEDDWAEEATGKFSRGRYDSDRDAGEAWRVDTPLVPTGNEKKAALERHKKHLAREREREEEKRQEGEAQKRRKKELEEGEAQKRRKKEFEEGVLRKREEEALQDRQRYNRLQREREEEEKRREREQAALLERELQERTQKKYLPEPGPVYGSKGSKKVSQTKRSDRKRASSTKDRSCPRCGEKVQETANFCFLCGWPLDNRCPSCNKKVQKVSRFCYSCGHQLGS